ncbi:MAG: hypothetical protein WAZ94_02785 [Phycisphaerales bacterium]
MTLKTSTGLAASALLSLAGSSALAQFESRWAGTGDFAYHTVDALSASTANPSRLLVAAGSALQPGTPCALDLSFWGSTGWQDAFGRRLWRLQGTNSWVQPTQIQQLPGGDYLVAARGSDPTNGDGAILMRFNSNLNHVWNYSHRDNDPNRGEPFAIPLASGKVLMVTPASGYGSRVVASDQTGPTGMWTRSYTDTLGADVLFTDGVQLPTGVVLLVGSYRLGASFSSEGCILAIDPATNGTPLGLWTYSEPGWAFSDFRSATLDPTGQTLFVSGVLANVGFPSFSTNAWAVKVNVSPFSTMAPQAAAWYIADFVPAKRGMAFRPGTPDELAIAGSHHDFTMAKSARVSAASLGNLRLEKFGQGVPPYTNFATGTLTPAGDQVLVGTYRLTSAAATQGYVVATNAAGVTSCSETLTAIADAAGVNFTVRTPIYVPPTVPPTAPPAIFQRSIVQESILIQLPAGPYCGDRLCTPDYNEDGNVDQDDVLYLLNVIGGGENPTGADPDFNQDGNVDQDDVSALISVVAGGDCP